MINEIETQIWEYFASLELPEAPTIYDYLVLSLRKKDIIATFNWDPFLWKALQRNHHVSEMPQSLFLHGSVAVGYCESDKIIGPVGCRSMKCGHEFVPSKLLYPIEKKKYADNPAISSAWDYLRKALKKAYILTIFGYGAPKSDVEAISLMKEAWGSTTQREFEEVEIIDIQPERSLREKWKPFIHSHHDRYCQSFFNSIAYLHPRRSCEATRARLMECQWTTGNPPPRNVTLDELQKWYAPLIEIEN